MSTTLPPGYTIQARPTSYKGIKMRSRLEADWAANMDAAGCEWAYEPLCFADETGQYLPDFRLNPNGTRPWFLEVKGPYAANDVEAIQKRMEIVWSSEPTARLILAIEMVGMYEAYGDKTRQWDRI
ncbi:hypothetical protein [Flavobacterium sp.]|uniref:hypothetical protein n=1 Tax=Flavobacterium sp. TaxID=239 RepID=UPI003263B399